MNTAGRYDSWASKRWGSANQRRGFRAIRDPFGCWKNWELPRNAQFQNLCTFHTVPAEFSSFQERRKTYETIFWGRGTSFPCPHTPNPRCRVAGPCCWKPDVCCWGWAQVSTWHWYANEVFLPWFRSEPMTTGYWQYTKPTPSFFAERTSLYCAWYFWQPDRPGDNGVAAQMLDALRWMRFGV